MAISNFVNYSTLVWSERQIQIFREKDVIRNDMIVHEFKPGATQVMFPIFGDKTGGAQRMGSAPAGDGGTPTSAINTLDTEDLFEELIPWSDIAKYGQYVLQGTGEGLSRQLQQHYLKKKVIALAKAAIVAGNTSTLTTTNPATYGSSFADATATLRNRHVTGLNRYAVITPTYFVNLKQNNFVTSTLYNSDNTAGNTGSPGEYLKYSDYEIWQVGGIMGSNFSATSSTGYLDQKYHYNLTTTDAVLWADDSFGVCEVIQPTVEINRSTDFKAWHLISYMHNGNVAIKTDGIQVIA